MAEVLAPQAGKPVTLEEATALPAALVVMQIVPPAAIEPQYMVAGNGAATRAGARQVMAVRTTVTTARAASAEMRTVVFKRYFTVSPPQQRALFLARRC